MPPSALRSVARGGCGLCPSGWVLAYLATLVSVQVYHHNGWVVMLNTGTFKGRCLRWRTSGALCSSTPRQFRENHRCQPVFATTTVQISNLVAKKRTLARECVEQIRGSTIAEAADAIGGCFNQCCAAPRRETQCDRGDFLRRRADRARRGCIPMELWMRALRLCGFLAFQCPLQNSTVHLQAPVTLCFDRATIRRSTTQFSCVSASACTASLQAVQYRSDPTAKVQSPRSRPTKVGARKQGLMVVRRVKRSTSCLGKVRGPIEWLQPSQPTRTSPARTPCREPRARGASCSTAFSMVPSVLEGTCSQEALAHDSSTRTFAVHISPSERDLLRLMQVPLGPLVRLDADSAGRGSSDPSVPWRTVERRRASDPLSILVAWRAGERSVRRHHTSPFNI